MTVDIRTGEITEPLSDVDAERVTRKIELRLDNIGENLEVLKPLVDQARDGQAHIGTGFRSWPDYIRGRFGERLERIAKFDRGGVVAMLSETGMSNRAIAGTINVSEGTVRNQVRNSYAPAQTPGPAPEGEAGAGSGHTPQGERNSESGADDPAETEATSGVNRPSDYPAAPAPAARPAITGMDGKTYTRPEPKAPRATPRRSLPDQFFDAAYDLGKRAESVHRLISDDRFPQNAEKVAAKHRNDLLRIRDLLEQVINALPSEESTHD